MTNDLGRSPDGSVYSAEPGPISVVPAVPVSIPNAVQFPDWRPIFQARALENKPWIWDVWDIEHPAECNHFPLVRVDSNGAADDLHECIAKMIADSMNARWASEANRRRREEASAIEARRAATPQSDAVHESAAPKEDAPTVSAKGVRP